MTKNLKKTLLILVLSMMTSVVTHADPQAEAAKYPVVIGPMSALKASVLARAANFCDTNVDIIKFKPDSNTPLIRNWIRADNHGPVSDARIKSLREWLGKHGVKCFAPIITGGEFRLLRDLIVVQFEIE